MRKYILILLLIIIAATNLQSQTEEVKKNLDMLALGEYEKVKKNLHDLLAKYPNDPGVMLLHGDAIKAVYPALTKYKLIVNKHGDSEWADDAYLRIVQFYSVIRDSVRAYAELQGFRKAYPKSPLLLPAAEVYRTSLALTKAGLIAGNSKAIEEAEKETDTEIAVPEPKPTEEADEKKYGLQVGIFSMHESAVAELERYREQRLQTVIQTKNVGGKTMYAVVIGNYDSHDSADKAKVFVKQICNCEPIVLEKKKIE